MKLCRFQSPGGATRVGLLADEHEIFDLGATSLAAWLESDKLLDDLQAQTRRNLPRIGLSTVKILPPVERQEVWAAGVTYLRSKKARMEESDFSATAYDRVYEAARPEIFFKSMPDKVVPAGEPIGIRADARWSVPEPELVLVLNSRGKVVGYTIGNDMSSRDIEGENLLYLPQAKIYRASCALGPFIRVGASETEARSWGIHLTIRRQEQVAFEGETSVGNIRRPFGELADYLFRSQIFPNGAALLTGTGIVPPDAFTLQAGDQVTISISGIGELTNPVITV